MAGDGASVSRGSNPGHRGEQLSSRAAGGPVHEPGDQAHGESDRDPPVLSAEHRPEGHGGLRNMAIWDFKLSDEDMAEVAKLDIGHGEIVDHSDPKFVQMLHQVKVHE